MSEEITVDTPVAGDNEQPVVTDTDADTSVEQKSDRVDTPAVEIRDGKMFVDGVRVYTRDDVNKIGANARRDVESKILQDLEVESFDKVKTVVKQLQTVDPEDSSLNINSLRDAVRKREATVEELKAELHSVKTEYALREHVSTLKDAMPGTWNQDQKSAVIDLMKARNMLHYQEGTFAIRNGEDYITTDGETPDYKTAVEVVGKSLGLPFAKKGIDTYEADKQPSKTEKQAIDEARIKSDPAYRKAYVNLRDKQRLSRSQITDAMIKKAMEGTPTNLGLKMLK